MVPLVTPFSCKGASDVSINIGGGMQDESLPFELSPTSGTAGAFPDDPLEVSGLALSALSIACCEMLLPLGAALDWLRAGDFVWELDGTSDKLAAAGILDLVAGVWLLLAG